MAVPTVISASIATDGLTLLITFSEVSYATFEWYLDASYGFYLTRDATNLTMDYVSGDGGSVVEFQITSGVIFTDDVVTLSQTTNEPDGVYSTSTDELLEGFYDTYVTNNSIEVETVEGELSSVFNLIAPAVYEAGFETTGIDGGWSRVTTQAKSGTYSIYSNADTGTRTSSETFELSNTAYLGVWWRYRGDYTTFKIKVDATAVLTVIGPNLGGSTGEAQNTWFFFESTLTSGSREITFELIGDPDRLSGDGAWVDDVSISYNNITATVSAAPEPGTLSITLADWTLSSAASVEVRGTTSTTLQNWTLSSASVTSISGSLVSTLGDWTLSSQGLNPILGELSLTLDDWTLLAFEGLGSFVDSTLDDWVLTSTASTVIFGGVVEAVLENWILESSAFPTVVGELGVILEDWSVFGGDASIVGNGNITLTLQDWLTDAQGTVDGIFFAEVNSTISDWSLSSESAIGTVADIDNFLEDWVVTISSDLLSIKQRGIFPSSLLPQSLHVGVEF